MNAAALRATAKEALSAFQGARDELADTASGSLVVSGMLAEQLARELGAGAARGAVAVGDDVRGAAVVVRVIAGEPSDEDDALVRECDRHGIPIVLVQLWPQAEWRAPFVLSPFVVECRAGEGFPVPAIAARISEAAERPSTLAARVPVLATAVESSVVRSTAVSSVLLALSRSPGDRQGLAVEQARMIGRLRSLDAAAEPDPPAVVAGAVAGTLAASYGFRRVAREARRVLPSRVADPLVAAAGTVLLARALRVLRARF